MARFVYGIRRALLIEGNELLRNVSAGQLRDAGVAEVLGVARIAQARVHLERERFDLVLCSCEFQGQAESGQDLLDELRREHLLSPDTVFMMVSSEVTYQQVAEAGEASIDSYLVRPYTTAVLMERLDTCINRRRELSPVFEALEANEPGQAFALALSRFQQGQRHGVYCGRLAAEMLLRFNRPEDAQLVFARIDERHPTAWAALGVARAQSACGDLVAARQTIQQVQSREPQSADAHELLGQVLIEHGEFSQALMHCLRAAELTPGCVMRSQIAATLAFYFGDRAQSTGMLEHACRLGARSRLFSGLNWVLLAFLRLDAGDTKGLRAVRVDLNRHTERVGADEHLVFLQGVVDVLQQWSQGAGDAALQATRTLTLQVDQENFSLESANLLLALWERVPEALWPEVQRLPIAQSIGLRLGVSKAVTEMMCAAAGRQTRVVATLRQSQQIIAQRGQQAVQGSMGSEAESALTQLIEYAETTRNARLFELAGLTLKRRGDRIKSLAELTERVWLGMTRHAKGVSHIAGVQRAGRSASGVPLRGWRDEGAIRQKLPSLEMVAAMSQAPAEGPADALFVSPSVAPSALQAGALLVAPATRPGVAAT